MLRRQEPKQFKRVVEGSRGAATSARPEQGGPCTPTVALVFKSEKHYFGSEQSHSSDGLVDMRYAVKILY